MGIDSEYPTMLKYTFILHFLIAWIFGIWLFALPDSFNTFIGHTTPADPVNIAYGALLIGIGLTSLLAFRASDWKSVKILVEMELVYTPVAIIGGIISLLTSSYPLWFLSVYMIIMALFFILLLIPYYQFKKS
jgi:hypothetical protein